MNELLPFSTSVELRSRGYLPHWEIDGAIYFITYRLNDSLPAHVLEELEYERKNLERLIGDTTAEQRQQVRTRYLRRLNGHLDDCHGECHLRNGDIATNIVSTWVHFDGARYQLIAWCVMPNHAHVIIRLFKGRDLWRTVHSWKSYTANFANRILKRQGPFWFRDYYDHCIRSQRARAHDRLCRWQSRENWLDRLAVRWVRRLVAGGPAGW